MKHRAVCLLALGLCVLRPAPSQAFELWGPQACGNLHRPVYGKIVKVWRGDPDKGIPGASDQARVYRRVYNNQGVEIAEPHEATPGMTLCHGDRIETWHTAWVQLHSLWVPREGGEGHIKGAVEIEGGTILELGQTLRQFAGGATYFFWDSLREEDEDLRYVQVGDSQTYVSKVESTLRLEVVDPCACEATLFVSPQDDPGSTPGQTQHRALLSGLDARGRPFEAWVTGGEAAQINTRDTNTPAVRPFTPNQEQQQHLEQRRAALVSTLKTTQRPPREAYAPVSGRVTLALSVYSPTEPQWVRMDGAPLPLGRWRARGGAWQAEGSTTLYFGEHRVEIGVEGASPLSSAVSFEPGERRITLEAGRPERVSAEVAAAPWVLPIVKTSGPAPAQGPRSQSSCGFVPTGAPTGAVYTLFEGSTEQLNFIELSAGRFCMGSPEGEGDPDEHPAHPVTLSVFAMGQSEVTQAQWRRVVQEGKRRGLKEVRGIREEPSHFKGDNLPVERVSYCDGVRFANLLSALHQLRPAYTVHGQCEMNFSPDSNGFRLPTNVEWEYAARAGTVDAWSFGEEEKICTYANVADVSARKFYENKKHRDSFSWSSDWTFQGCDDGYSQTAPVCSFQSKGPHPWGLCDIHGNLSEWVWVDYHYDDIMFVPEFVPVSDERWPELGTTEYQPVRGGSWTGSAYVARAANDSSVATDFTWLNVNVGVRLVLPVVPPEP